MGKYSVETSGARGTKHVKSTGLDTSSLRKSTEVSMLKNDRIGGAKDNLAHTISGSALGKHSKGS